MKQVHIYNLHISLLLLSMVLASAARLFPTAQYFQLDGSTAPCVKLSWLHDPSASQYSVYRQINGAQIHLVATVSGNTYDDYEVPSGQIKYSIFTQDGHPDPYNQVGISTQPSPASNYFLTFDNIQQSTLRTISTIKLRGMYYQYSVYSDQGGMSEIVEATSSDGFNFSNKVRVVLTRKEVCEDIQRGCKLEAVTFRQNPRTLEVVMWGHWEYRDGYGEGRAAVAFGMPGGAWTFGGAFRPLYHDSRDLTFFLDDDGTGYIVSSTAMNTDMNIYRLSPDLHKVSSLVATVLQGQRREAPSLIKHQNIYYLFTSQAAGWYPSLGQYISAPNLAGPWSESRNIGNLAGFGAQSGEVYKLGATYVMRANQWKAQWRDSEPPNRQIILPISLRDGWAQYYFYERLRYFDNQQQGGVFGVQSGKMLSGIPKVVAGASTASSAASLALLSSPGINLDPARFFKPSAVPFECLIDLGKSYGLRQFDLTTKLVGGSETAYQFVISGAANANGPFQLVADERRNTRVGFVTIPLIRSTGTYRYVKLDILKVTNVQNHQEADWAVGLHQFTIYGQPVVNARSIASN